MRRTRSRHKCLETLDDCSQTDCVLDAALVITDEDGKQDWHALRPRSAMKVPRVIAKAAATRPASLNFFDVLIIGSSDVRPSPFVARKIALRLLVPPSPSWRIADTWDDGFALLHAVTGYGL